MFNVSDSGFHHLLSNRVIESTRRVDHALGSISSGNADTLAAFDKKSSRCAIAVRWSPSVCRREPSAQLPLGNSIDRIGRL